MNHVKSFLRLVSGFPTMIFMQSCGDGQSPSFKDQVVYIESKIAVEDGEVPDGSMSSNQTDTASDGGDTISSDGDVDSSADARVDGQTMKAGKDATKKSASKDSLASSMAKVNPDEEREYAPPEVLQEQNTQITQAELGLCAKHFGALASQITVAGTNSKESKRVQGNNIIAIKLSGNRSVLDLEIAGKSTLTGLCLMLTGNQSSAQVKVYNQVAKLVYYGTGNQSFGKITIGEGGKIDQAFVRLSGNQAKLTLSGVGPYPCPAPVLKGNDPEFTCAK